MQQQFELACRIIGLLLVLYGIYAILALLLLVFLASGQSGQSGIALTVVTHSLIVFTGLALLRSPAPVVRFAYGGASPSRPTRRPAKRVSTDVEEA